ncbi:PHP domain-containing protein [Candidatus Saccharibacteria bacterium]|nr:PHP domain-containing protein [Candidatus Saccharibacteria bacterium]MBI3338476.1 PHP domain-containing protein [Candidatus Saccharibacteria bacterium]
MYKIDLHTHSSASPDGGIKVEQYAHALATGLLDVIAVTDHNRIDFAVELHKKLGNRIIIGEEIMTTDGEIIGLYLDNLVEPNLSPLETVKQIKKQGGIVYIPHPFETIRKGLMPVAIEKILDQVDIIETCNGRAFLQNRGTQAITWARINHIIGAASSDAHGYQGLGKTYTVVKQIPTHDTLLDLFMSGTLVTNRPNLRSLLYPKYHHLRKRLLKT